jgi:hypothetical protein
MDYIRRFCRSAAVTGWPPDDSAIELAARLQVISLG